MLSRICTEYREWRETLRNVEIPLEEHWLSVRDTESLKNSFKVPRILFERWEPLRIIQDLFWVPIVLPYTEISFRGIYNFFRVSRILKKSWPIILPRNSNGVLEILPITRIPCVEYREFIRCTKKPNKPKTLFDILSEYVCTYPLRILSEFQGSVLSTDISWLENPSQIQKFLRSMGNPFE